MISKTLWNEFKKKFEVVSVFIFCENKFLLLHRQNNKPLGNTWGAPAGKVDPGEELGEALCRETFEETSIDLSNHKIKYITKYYVNHGNVNFIYHVFSVNLDTFPKVSINNLEHKDFDWYTKEDSLKLGLVEDMDEVIKECVLI